MIYGRRKGARSWQEHFDSILRSEEARQRGFTVESHPKCRTLYYVREADGVLELHVDDGHGCGKETIVAELLTFLSEKIEMKYVQGIWCGSCEYLKTVKVRDGKKLTSIPNKKHFQSALKKLEMSDCKGSISPKLDKACIDGDNEELSVQILNAYSVVSQQRKNGHSKYSTIVMYEVEQSDSVGDETVETTFEVRQRHGGHVYCV